MEPKDTRSQKQLIFFQYALDDDNNSVSVIACPVDYSENIKLTDKLGSLTDSI
jgi:hypothetical protein